MNWISEHADYCAEITQRCFPHIQEDYRNNKLWADYVDSLITMDPEYIIKRAIAFDQSERSTRGRALEDAVFVGISNLYNHPAAMTLIIDIKQRYSFNGIEYDGIVLSTGGIEVLSITTTPRERKKFTWPSESRNIRKILPDARFVGVIAYMENYHEECNEDSRVWIRNLKDEFAADVNDILYLADRDQLKQYYTDRIHRDLNAKVISIAETD